MPGWAVEGEGACQGLQQSGAEEEQGGGPTKGEHAGLQGKDGTLLHLCVCLWSYLKGHLKALQVTINELVDTQSVPSLEEL